VKVLRLSSHPTTSEVKTKTGIRSHKDRLPIASPASLQAAWHDNAVCGARSRHRKDHRDAFKTPSPRRVFRFMNSVTAAFPNRKLHVILDNLNTHKKNEHWLKAHPNEQFHFTPTSASWLKGSRFGSRSCRGSRLAAPPSQASNSSRSTSMPTSRHITTKLNPSSGPRRSVNAASKAAVSLSSRDQTQVGSENRRAFFRI
jgi:DDE superfamily endonuclease